MKKWLWLLLAAVGVPIAVALITTVGASDPWVVLGALLAYWALLAAGLAVVVALSVRARRRYLRYVVTEHSRLEGAFRVPLLRVYVTLRLSPRLRRTSPADRAGLPSGVPPGGTAVWAYLWPGGTEGQALAIVGPPGSGKTTLLKHVALTLTGDKEDRQAVDAPPVVPLLLSLGDCARAVTERAQPSLVEVAAGRAREVPARWLGRQLRTGQCLVLLDGLDEVPAEASARVVAWIEAQMARYPKSRFLVTARSLDARRPLLRSAEVLEIRPLVREQVGALVSRWYGIQARVDGLTPLEGRDRVADLLRALRRSPLASNPLLLTLLATVHHHGLPVPTSRTALFAAACRVFTGRDKENPLPNPSHSTPERERKVPPLRGEGNESWRILEPLAYQMMVDRQREIPLSEALQVSRVAAETLLKSSGGLLLRSEDGYCRFVHHSFQAYLASVHAIALAPSVVGTGGGIHERVQDAWWHETLVFCAGGADATPIVEACLAGEAPGPAALRLARDCVAEARTLSDETRARFEQVLREAVEDEDPERRDVAAETLLALRLARARPAAPDAELISCAEYQAFLDERRAQGRYVQPDHWRGYRYAQGEGMTPVLGVRLSDAVSFCAWLTERVPDGWRCRLPRQGELDPQGVRGGGYWTTSVPGGHPEVEEARVEGVPGEGAQAEAVEQQVVLTLARDLGRAHGREHDLDSARTIAASRAADLPIPSRPSSVEGARAQGRLDRALSRARVSDLTLARAGDAVLADVIDHIAGRARRAQRASAGLDLARARAFASLSERLIDRDPLSPSGLEGVSHDLATAVDRARDRVVDRALDRVLSSVIAIDLDRAATSAGDLTRTTERAAALLSAIEAARASISTAGSDLLRPRRAGSHLDGVVRDIARASDLAHAVARDLAHVVQRALTSAGQQARENGLARALGLHTAIDRARDLSLSRAVELASVGDLHVASELANALSLDLDLARARAEELAGHLEPDRMRGLVRALRRAGSAVRDMALAFALAGDLDSDVTIASTLARAGEQTPALSPTGIGAGVPALSADYDEVAQSWRWHVRLQTLALAVRLYPQAGQESEARLYLACLDLYVDLAELEGRIQGALPAYEGIRVVLEADDP